MEKICGLVCPFVHARIIGKHFGLYKNIRISLKKPTDVFKDMRINFLSVPRCWNPRGETEWRIIIRG